jgi:hypothetical protein
MNALTIALILALVPLMFSVIYMFRTMPIILMLFRTQVAYADTWNDLLKLVEDMDDRMSAIETKELKRLRERIDKLENPRPARTRRKVTA